MAADCDSAGKLLFSRSDRYQALQKNIALTTRSANFLATWIPKILFVFKAFQTVSAAPRSMDAALKQLEARSASRIYGPVS
jgi:hypothetical protein